jgi:hypothetical protein
VDSRDRKRDIKAARKDSDYLLFEKQHEDGASSMGGRSSKRSVGSRALGGNIFKAVEEKEWKLNKKTDAQRRKFFNCLKCGQEARMDNRCTHACK